MVALEFLKFDITNHIRALTDIEAAIKGQRTDILD